MNLFSFLGSTKLKVDKMLLQEVSEEIEVDDEQVTKVRLLKSKISIEEWKLKLKLLLLLLLLVLFRLEELKMNFFSYWTYGY
ncbi:hypothetical protein AAZX31_07G214600 [Glycine max]